MAFRKTSLKGEWQKALWLLFLNMKEIWIWVENFFLANSTQK